MNPDAAPRLFVSHHSSKLDVALPSPPPHRQSMPPRPPHCAPPPSFNCARASARAERLICGDTACVAQSMRSRIADINNAPAAVDRGDLTGT